MGAPARAACLVAAAILASYQAPWIPAGLLAQGAAETPAPRSAGEGVYASSQAAEGGALFEQACSRCHSRQELSGPRFRGAWTARTLRELYGVISTTMPLDQPASFRAEQYAALLAYILELNGYPPGNHTLGWEEQELSRIRIDPPPGTGPPRGGGST